MNNQDATKLELHKSFASLTKSVIPLVSASAMFLHRTSATFSPIPGSSYVHNRLENSKQSDDKLTLINNFVDTYKGVSSPVKVKKERTRLVTPPRHIPARLANIPPPKNGLSYNKMEVYSFLQPYNTPTRSVIRSKMITKLVNSGYVKGGRSTIYRDLKVARSGIKLKNYDFKGPGQPPILSNIGVSKICEKIKINNGRAYDSDEIKNLMIDQVKINITEQGDVPLINIISPSRTTIS